MKSMISLALVAVTMTGCLQIGAKILAESSDAGDDPIGSTTGGTGNTVVATGGNAMVDNTGGATAQTIETGGAPQVGGGPSVGVCAQPSLANAPPVILGCVNATRLCPHSFQINVPDYGPFTSCCPDGYPYSCANGTPNSCFATAEKARASCGENCVTCSDISEVP
jgi:hypothetical protein